MPRVKRVTALFSLSLLDSGCGSSTPTMQSNASSASKAVSAKAADESAALDAIRKTNEAQSTYFKMHRRYALTYEELIEARLLKSEPTGAETGYEFKLRPAADAQTYKLSAAPADANASSARRFF